MARLESALNDMEALDRCSELTSFVHALDPRVKILTTFAFLLTVVSFDRYAISRLTPLAVFPVVLGTLGRIPAAVLFRYLRFACPFALLLGIFNPLFDRSTHHLYPGIDLSGGWISLASILFRFLLTVSAVLILMATTGLPRLASAFAQMGVPRILVTQVLMLYRYLSLLPREAARMTRAHSLRALSGRRMPIRVWGSLAGNLLLRAHDRGHRIHAAMLCRGFTGEMPGCRSFQLSRTDILFLLFWAGFFFFVRWSLLVERTGEYLAGLFQ